MIRGTVCTTFTSHCSTTAFDDGLGSGLGGNSNSIGGSSVHAVHARARGGGGGGGVGVGVGGRAAAEQASNDAAHKDLVS